MEVREEKFKKRGKKRKKKRIQRERTEWGREGWRRLAGGGEKDRPAVPGDFQLAGCPPSLWA